MMTLPIQHKLKRSIGTRTFGMCAGVGISLVLSTSATLTGNAEENSSKNAPLTIESKFYGTVRSIPAGSVGLWTVNSREILVTSETKIIEEYGRADVGAYVEVEGTNIGKIFTANKIGVKRARQ
jgi:hypothetical protein